MRGLKRCLEYTASGGVETRSERLHESVTCQCERFDAPTAAAVKDERRKKRRSFNTKVGGGVGVDEVAALFGRTWQLPVAKTAQEGLWAVAYDAYMTLQRLRQQDPCMWRVWAGKTAFFGTAP